MKDYSDINYIPTSIPGQVILRAGREVVKTLGVNIVAEAIGEEEVRQNKAILKYRRR